MVEVIQGEQHRYFKYDSLGRLIRVKQPEQEVNTPALDLADNYNTSGKWTAKFTYDLTGNVLTATDANGTVITNAYDKANRVITKSYSNEPNGQTTPSVSYFYDGKCSAVQTAACFAPQSPNYAKGKLTQVKSSVSETRYTSFDNLGRLLQMEQRTPVTGETIANAVPRVSSYQYNFAGALVEETYPSGRVVKNEFEADGDLSRIYGKASTPNAVERTYANGFSYTPDGKIQRLRLGNGRWESAKFNERLQVTELALGTSDGDGSLWKLGYEYGEIENGSVNQAKNTGNIARQTLSFTGLTNPLIQTYKYDSLYRLTEAKEVSGANQTWKESFSYDRYGNRIGKEKFVGTTQIVNDNKTHPTINPNTNRFNTGQGYSYDKNGNLIDDAEGRTFIFNGENKQRFVVQSGNNVGEYFYDGEGNRVKKKVYEADGITVKEETVFVYSSGKLVAEYSTKPLPQNPTTNWTVTDQLGSPRVIVNSLGEVVSRRDFLPFGEEAISNIGERPTALKYGTTDSVRQKFTGYQKDDETGLDFAEARMYENRHGRFTAVDPLLASGNSAYPQSFNRYLYVQNNPITGTDPTGMCGGQGQPQCPTIYNGNVYTNANQTNFNDEQNDQFPYTFTGSTPFIAPKTGQHFLVTTFGWMEVIPGQPVNTDGIREMINGFGSAADDKINGMGKAAFNMGAETLNATTNPLGGLGELIGSPNPLRISPLTYNNPREAGWGFITTAGVIVGTGRASAVFRGGAPSLSIGSRAGSGGAGRTANKFNIFGEGEAGNYLDVSTNIANAKGRPLTSSFSFGSADRIFIRNAPVNGENTISEILRLSRPGTRVTYMGPSQGQLNYLQNALGNRATMLYQRTWTTTRGQNPFETTITTFRIIE